MFLQPQIDLATGRTVGFEALARWNDERLGRVSPEKFIPLAEETRLIGEIGRYILDEACRSLRAWIDAGNEPISIGVNVSPLQLAQDEFADTVARAISEFELDPRMIELEITETVMVRDLDSVIPRIEALRNIGVRISIDDFGTGYSALSYLQRLPVDRVKIDRSFIAALQSGDSDDCQGARLVRAIVEMAHIFGLDVVAEGVETSEQLEFLTEIGCEVAQGFFFDEPLPAGEAMDRASAPSPS